MVHYLFSSQFYSTTNPTHVLVLVDKTNKRLFFSFFYLYWHLPENSLWQPHTLYNNLFEFLTFSNQSTSQDKKHIYFVLKINEVSDNKGEKNHRSTQEICKNYAFHMHSKKKTSNSSNKIQNSITYANNQVVNFDEEKVWFLTCLELSSFNLLPIMWQLKRPSMYNFSYMTFSFFFFLRKSYMTFSMSHGICLNNLYE